MRIEIAAFLLSLAADPLPEGDDGIAVDYPNDEGIGGDQAVIFADDFESYSAGTDLWGTYDALFQEAQTRIATEPENVYAGDKALEFTVPQQDSELSNSASKFVSPELDVLFLRYYSKFDAPFDVVGSSHNGSSISAHYFDNGQATPGIPADGMNKFLVNLENWRGEAATPSPGDLNVYVYHPTQRSQWGDHFFASGAVLPFSSDPFDFGPDFVPRPDIIPELERWYCYELMVQANTPGELDGRIAFWLDGELAADFQNLRFRDIDSLKIDRFGIGFHIGSNPAGETRKWYDNVVAATSYIGPISEPGAGDDDSSTAGDDSSDGGDEGASGDGTSGPGSDDETGASSDAQTDGGSVSGSDPPADGSSDGGCGCNAPARGAGAFALLALLGLLRRRR